MKAQFVAGAYVASVVQKDDGRKKGGMPEGAGTEGSDLHTTYRHNRIYRRIYRIDRNKETNTRREEMCS